MSAIKGSRTKPEEEFRKAAWKLGFRYRIKSRLPGRPDLVFTKNKIAVFIDGCFWHACPIHTKMPKTNTLFWKTKLNKNKKRDELVNQQLAEMQWSVLRFWQHEIKTDLGTCLSLLQKKLKKTA